MTKRFSSKTRREHLKNLRKIRKFKVATGKPAAARSSLATGPGLLITVGLVLSIAALVVLAGSAILQDRIGSFEFASAIQATAEKTLPAIDPATIEVRVLNGCGVPGAGRSMASRLRDLHFDVVDSGNAENFSYTHTLVIGHSNRLDTARIVARSMGCSRVSSRPDNLAMVDVTVILGQDWKKFLSSHDDMEELNTWEKLIAKAKSLLGME